VFLSINSLPLFCDAIIHQYAENRGRRKNRPGAAMQPLRKKILSAGTVLALIFSPVFLSGAEKPSVREVKVGIAVTPEVKNNKDWKQQFERRLAYTSKIFETEFKVRFKPVTYLVWNPVEANREMGYLIEDLQNNFPLKNVDVMIGLTQMDPKLLPGGEVKDFDSLGISRPFSGYLVIRYPEMPLFKVQEETVLAHELGHAFGAVHTNQPDTIMCPLVTHQIPTRFDPDNHRVILLTRGMDFRLGAEVFDRPLIERLLSAYLKLAAYNQPFEFYQALGAFYLKLGKDEDALKAWQAAVSLQDDNARVHYDLGILHAKTGEYDMAVNELAKALVRFRLPKDKALKIQALSVMGNAYFKKGDLSGAYGAWSRALVLDPDNWDLKTNLANVQMMRGQVDDAIKNYEDAVDEKKADSTLYANMAFAYYKKNDFRKSVEYLQKALSQLPADKQGEGAKPVGGTSAAEIYKNLGLAYLGLRNFEEAAKNMEKACQLQPSIDGYKRLGEIYFEQRNWEKCSATLLNIAQTRKKDPNIMGMLGIALSNQNQPEKALFIFNEGLKACPQAKKQAVFHRYIGNLYLAVNNPEEAQKEFRYAVSKDWSNPDGHLGLAVTYLNQRKAKEGRESLNTVLRLDPNNAKAKELLAKLGKP